MWPDRVSNPGPPTYESGALPIALRGPAKTKRDFLHSIAYLNCINNHISLDLLLISAHARLPNYLNCYLLPYFYQKTCD